MKREFQELNELLNIDSTEALHHALKSILSGLGFDKYAYYSELKNRNDETPTVLTNYPDEWVSYYIANNYEEIDPVQVYAKKTVLPIHWGGAEYVKQLSRQQRKLFNEAEKYDICIGLTVPAHSLNRFSTLTVTSVENDVPFQNRIKKNESYLQLLVLTFSESINKFQPANQPTNQQTNKPVKLTKREQECLFFISKGHSYDDTAIKLCVSRNTVLYFAKNIRRKLGVSNIQHAVAIAIKKNLIDR